MAQNSNSLLSAWLPVMGFFIVIWLAYTYIATPLWEKYVVRYDKPWWSGTEYQRLCDAFDSSKCYTLPITSDGNTITRIDFPNGGYLLPSSVTCSKVGHSDYGVDRFCSFYENEKEWDVIPR